MMRLSRLRPLRSKKYLLIISSLVLVVLLGSYILWSKQTWAQFTPSYTQWQQGVQGDIEEINALPVSTSKEQDVVAAKLTDVSSRIEADYHTLCVLSPLVQWQQKVVSAFHDATISCQKMVANTVTFQKQLATVMAYNAADQALSKIIASVPQSGDLADDSWKKQVAAWDDAVKAAEKMSVSDTFKPTQQLAIKHMMTTKAAWQEIIAAHQAKDKPKYLAAQNTLASAIDGFDEISVTSQQTFTKLSSELEAATAVAFATN